MAVPLGIAIFVCGAEIDESKRTEEAKRQRGKEAKRQRGKEAKGIYGTEEMERDRKRQKGDNRD